MAHLLWNLHLLGFAIAYLYFLYSFAPKDFFFIWRVAIDDFPVIAKVGLTIAGFVVWTMRAFIWEFSLPYMKSRRFRKLWDEYFVH